MSSVRTRRLLQEVDDTYRRSLTGGFFYLVGWLIVAGYAGAMVREPLSAWGVTAALLAFSLARIVHRPPSDAEANAARMQRWLSHHWSIAIGSSVVWSGAFAWAVVDPGFAEVRTTAMLCTIALATAIAHAFSMRRDFAFIAIGILYLPGLAALWQHPEERANTLVMTVYFAYLVISTLRSHAEYQRGLDLDQVLRDQRDLFARQSRVDALTELANRRYFADVLDTATQHAREAGTPLSMLVLDLDHFKAVNDRHGHAVGDAVLTGFAARLRLEFSGAGETAARLGGEEFGVLLEGLAEEAAAVRAERFRRALVVEALRIDELALPITVSIGVAQFDSLAHRNGDGLYRAADRAVYRAKAEGRNRVSAEARAHAL